jgi:type 1 glutamine amidotransferase
LGQTGKKNVLMIAGSPSHGYGAHEHYAGLKVLEESIKASTDNVDVTVVRGWPNDTSLVDKADSIVIYSDGGQRHLAIPHLDTLKAKLAKGCGFVCLHYAVELVPGPPGDAWVDLLGGHFEVHWSVNPHWVADFKSLPEHPITQGVKPFANNDEWYFHMRFKDSDKLVPILAAVAPPETMRRKDGAHSGNPAVRKSVAAGEKQTVAWAYERPDGGRSFGFSGGHYHWNWGHDDVRRLVTNAIRWTAGDAIPAEGSTDGKQLGVDELLENQDYEPPKKFDPEAIKSKFDLQSSARSIESDTAARESFATPLLASKKKLRINENRPVR